MRTLHVLLVTTAGTRQVLRSLLAGRPEIHVAAEAMALQEARDVLAMLRVDLVLLETSLRDEDGFELLPVTPINSRVICLTSGSRDMMRALALGSVECVRLPVERDALDEALDTVLGRSPVASFAACGFGAYQLPGQFSL